MSLPQQVIVPALRWLDEVDAGLVAISSFSRGFDPAVTTRLAVATTDVAARVANFRAALAGRARLADLLPSSWVPLDHVDAAVAEVIGAEVRRVATLPEEVVAAAHTTLTDDDERKAFLRQVGGVTGIIFVNLARTLWNDYPHLAPPGWADADSGA